MQLKRITCYWCDIELVSRTGLGGGELPHNAITADHIILASEGGGRGDNIVDSCNFCNNARGNTYYEEWIHVSNKYIKPYRNDPEKLLQLTMDDNFPEKLLNILALIHHFYPHIKERAYQDLEYMVRFNTRPVESAYLFEMASKYRKAWRKLRGRICNLYFEQLANKPILEVLEEYKKLPSIYYTGHWRELIIMSRQEALYSKIHRSGYKNQAKPPYNDYRHPKEVGNRMPLKESLKDAGYTYVRFDKEQKVHILSIEGQQEVWVANKNHASYGLIYKNTHLEFCANFGG